MTKSINDKMWTYVLYWTDPDDPDHGTSREFEHFFNLESLLSDLNDLLQSRPNIVPRVFQIFNEMEVERTEIVTRFTISKPK